MVKFETPTMEVIEFDADDVITTSGGIREPIELPDL